MKRINLVVFLLSILVSVLEPVAASKFGELAIEFRVLGMKRTLRPGTTKPWGVSRVTIEITLLEDPKEGGKTEIHRQYLAQHAKQITLLVPDVTSQRPGCASPDPYRELGKVWDDFKNGKQISGKGIAFGYLLDDKGQHFGLWGLSSLSVDNKVVFSASGTR